MAYAVSFLALLALCAFFVLRLRTHSALAPLLSLSVVVLYFMLAGVAGVLLPAGYVFIVLCLILGGYAIFYVCKQKNWWKAFITPGFLLFVAGTLVLLVYLGIRQPVFSQWDEFSLWGTGAKLLKQQNTLYTTATVGWPWTATQNPTLFMLGYFVQLLSAQFAPWAVYWAYGMLYMACFAALVAVFSFKQWRVLVPVSVLALLTPYIFIVFFRQVYLNKAYLLAYGDMPAGVLFGGVLACYFALRKLEGKLWQVLLPLAMFALVKDNTLPIVLVAAGIIVMDYWLVPPYKMAEQPLKKRTWAKGIAVVGAFAAPLGAVFVWGRHSAWANAQNPYTEGASTGVSQTQSIIDCIQQLLGRQPKTERFAQTLHSFVLALFGKGEIGGVVQGKLFPVSMAGSAFVTALVILAMFVLAFICVPKGLARRRIALSGVLSTGGFVGYLFVLLVSYGFIMKEPGITDIDRYLSSYFAGWFMLALLMLGLAAVHAPWRSIFARTGVVVLAVAATVTFALWVPSWLSVLGYSDTAYLSERTFAREVEEINDKITLQQDERVFFVNQSGEGDTWFRYAYHMLPNVLDYSITGGGVIQLPNDTLSAEEAEKAATLQELQQYLAKNNCRYILVDNVDESFVQSYGALFAGQLQQTDQPALYQLQEAGLYALVE